MIIQELNSLYDGKNMFHFKEQNSIQNRIELFRHIHIQTHYSFFVLIKGVSSSIFGFKRSQMIYQNRFFVRLK